MAKTNMHEIDSSELAIFRKKVKMLASYKGKGTELISLYIPYGTDRSSVMDQLTNEMSQSSNIKSSQTRNNVQGALRKIINFLKQINFRIPEKGLAIFAGNISQTEGRTDIRLFAVQPVKELRTKLYWCDSEFHLAPLQEMLKPSEIYGLVAIDKNEATIATLIGKHYDIVGHFTSNVAGKVRAGGWSAKRFEHLREEAAQEFYKRISEKVNSTFLPYGEKLKGLIIAGPGMTKDYFIGKDLIDHRLKEKILAKLDIGYTDESGIREIVQKADEILKDTDLMRERKIVNEFMTAIAKNGLATYGEKEVGEALSIGKVSVLLLSEDLEWRVLKIRCTTCNDEKTFIVKTPQDEKKIPDKCTKCTSPVEVVEEIDYVDYMLEKAHQTGAEIKVISTETSEGKQFYLGFGGIGALLRYK